MRQQLGPTSLLLTTSQATSFVSGSLSELNRVKFIIASSQNAPEINEAIWNSSGVQRSIDTVYGVQEGINFRNLSEISLQ